MYKPVFARGPLPQDPSYTVAFFLSDLLLQVQGMGGPSSMVGNLRTAEQVISFPLEMRSGGSSFLVVGQPKRQYLDDSIWVPAPPESRFVVDVDASLVVHDCWFVYPWVNSYAQNADPLVEILDALGPLLKHDT